MKKRINFVSQSLAAGFFTLVIIIDFFPNLGINMLFGIAGFIIFVLLAAITHQKGEPLYRSSKQEFIFTVLSGIYLFSLLIILNLLGGNSQSAISLTHPILLVLYFSALLFSYIRYKKKN
ncbi:hypothetical protein [Oceanobacillus halotolerans]|uniref:hypothetical protein n=1 Tax=Oceanobacillus halotolerans TaxID=2663380 RepID=UPI0013DC9D49|nr:hypothetical protein [Oceanobacillus halotolerans]